MLKFVGSLFDENMLLEISAKNIPCFCTTDTFQLQFTRNWFSVVDEDNGMDALHWKGIIPIEDRQNEKSKYFQNKI